MQAALRGATIDENNLVHFIEACYCLEGGLYPMEMEIPVLEKYFKDIKVKDARLRDQCTMECEFCDCTRSIKLPGKSLVHKESQRSGEQETNKGNVKDNSVICSFVEIGRIELNRKKQRTGIEGLEELLAEYSNNKDRQDCAISNSNDTISKKKKLNPIAADAAISGLFVIFYDGIDCFRIKNISDTHESRQMLKDLGINNFYEV
jgi:hypothetical protein